MQQLLWKTVWCFPKLPAILFLCIYLKKFKTSTHKNTRTQMFIIEPVFMMAKRRKEPRCASTDEWISKLWYTHAMEYYTTIKEKEVLIHATMRMNLERSQAQRSHVVQF